MQALSRELKQQLPATLVLDHPSVTAISTYLSSETSWHATLEKHSCDHSTLSLPISTYTIRREVSLNDSSLIRIGSITKTVVAIAVLRLMEQGSLQIGQPVSEILPYFNPASVHGPPMTQAIRAITIFDLLTHSSGLGYGRSVSWKSDLVDKLYDEASLTVTDLGGPRMSQDWERPLEAVVRQLGLMPLKFQPGSGFEYSMGHVVLGDVIETLCHQKLSEALQTLVFDPLGVTSARFVRPPPIREVTEQTRPSTFDMEVAELELAESGLAMSGRDLHRILSSINPSDQGNDRVLLDTTLEIALTPTFDCLGINNIASTPLRFHSDVTDWSLLGPLRGDTLVTSGIYGVASAIDEDGELIIVVRDQMLQFWDSTDLSNNHNNEEREFEV